MWLVGVSDGPCISFLFQSVALVALSLDHSDHSRPSSPKHELSVPQMHIGGHVFAPPACAHVHTSVSARHLQGLSRDPVTMQLYDDALSLASRKECVSIPRLMVVDKQHRCFILNLLQLDSTLACTSILRLMRPSCQQKVLLIHREALL